MKLSNITIILIGLAVCFWCLLYGWVNWSPNEREAQARRDNKALAETEANKEGAAKKRRQKAVDEVMDEAAKWRAINATKTPPASLALGGIDISENGAQLMVDSRVFWNNAQRAVNKQVLYGGVKLVGTGPKLPEPGMAASTILAEYYNYPVIPFPVVIFDLGTITVTGTYDQIMANVRHWSKMPNYLAVADGLRLEGTSPNLTGSYSVSIVGYIHGSKVFAPIPETPGASTSTGGNRVGGFGGPGAPSGGMMGGARGPGSGGPMGAPGGGGGSGRGAPAGAMSTGASG